MTIQLLFLQNALFIPNLSLISKRKCQIGTVLMYLIFEEGVWIVKKKKFLEEKKKNYYIQHERIRLMFF